MTKTVIGVFDHMSDAQAVVQDLVDLGLSRDQISLVANDASGAYGQRGAGDKMDDTEAEQAGSGALAGAGIGGALGLLVGLGALAIPGIGPVIAAGPLAAALGSTAIGAGVGAAAGGLVGPLVDAGVPRPAAEQYSESVRRGSTLVVARAPDALADQTVAVMERHNVVDIDERGAEYRQSGWSGFQASSEPMSSAEIERERQSRSQPARPAAARTSDAGETVLPVVEEQLQVGKRAVERGRARIHTTVTERPVEEQVRLREEHVHVDRRPVDRPVGAGDEAFQEREFEVTERAEEAVVAKQARVIEEVVVRKDVDERTETVRDTVRRTDVEVEQAGASARSVGGSGLDADFRSYYDQRLAGSGYSYEQYQPVFRYGYSLAGHDRYQGKRWEQIEADARRDWEARNPNSWDQFKDSVRYAWERATRQS